MVGEKLCPKCGKSMKDGDLYCEWCGTKINSSRNGLIEKYFNEKYFNKFLDLFKKNSVRKVVKDGQIEYERYRRYSKLRLFIGLIVLFFVLFALAGGGNNSTTTEQPKISTTTEQPKIIEGAITNITDVTLNIRDSETDYSKDNYSSLDYILYYSYGDLKFDVTTNGSIYNYTTNVKFYNGDKLLSTYIKSPSSYSSSDYTLNSGINHVSLDMSNKGSGSEYLPDNGTITDIIIVLEAKVDGVNTKLFETPKVNVGSVKLRYFHS
ncbi:MAG: zinc-ribbon domain-containing protein [Methanobrevibacter sp.]|jgi:hypothetical protein|nr:zinc-ribbon domain-containing protein [Candidatus Methanovirga meridionalis]